MDQIVIKLTDDDFDNIDIGNKVIIFDTEHSIDSFEQNVKKSKKELFYYLGKSSRIENK